MKSFREIVKAKKIVQESPVGSVGRTSNKEAMEHIENTDIARKFRKIVKELGGKTVARQLLATMSPDGNLVSKPTGKTNIDEKLKTMSPNKFLRDLGFKIKDEVYEKYSFGIKFYTTKDAKDAYEELVDNGFLDYYLMTMVGDFIDFQDA
jgi:hypothetical protein